MAHLAAVVALVAVDVGAAHPVPAGGEGGGGRVTIGQKLEGMGGWVDVSPAFTNLEEGTEEGLRLRDRQLGVNKFITTNTTTTTKTTTTTITTKTTITTITTITTTTTTINQQPQP